MGLFGPNSYGTSLLVSLHGWSSCSDTPPIPYGIVGAELQPPWHLLLTTKSLNDSVPYLISNLPKLSKLIFLQTLPLIAGSLESLWMVLFAAGDEAGASKLTPQIGHASLALSQTVTATSNKTPRYSSIFF